MLLHVGLLTLTIPKAQVFTETVTDKQDVLWLLVVVAVLGLVVLLIAAGANGDD